MGGLGSEPVESGTTTTVRRARLSASAVITTAGRVLRSRFRERDRGLPTRRRRAEPQSYRQELPCPSATGVSPRVVEPVIDRGSFPLGHFGCQLLVFLDGQRGLVQGIVIAAILRGQRFFQQPLNEFAALPRRNIALEPPGKLVG